MRECLEVINELRFDDITDLYQRREEIKEKYLKMPLDYKELYKWYYFYQLCILNYSLKSIMWTYLNNETYSSEINMDLSLEYSKFLKKKDKMLKIYRDEEEFDDIISESQRKEA